jgi:hypothetical protein
MRMVVSKIICGKPDVFCDDLGLPENVLVEALKDEERLSLNFKGQVNVAGANTGRSRGWT